MDDLRQSIADLEIQEGEIERQLGNAETDEEARQITNDLNLVRNRLSEKREELRIAQEKEQVRAEVIEEKIHAEEIPLAIAGIDFTELPAEVITLIDAVVKADRRRMLNEHAIELEQLETEARTNGRISEELRGKLDECERVGIERGQEVDRLKSELFDLNILAADVQRNRDNAARLLEEANAEINRLKSEIEDYQRAKVFGERQTQHIIDVTPEENTNINAAVDAVKKLYAKVEDWGSVQKVIKPDGSYELATRQQVATEWQAADVPDSFRNADNNSDTQDNTVPSSEAIEAVEPPELQFPTQDEPTVPEHVLDGESATEDATTVTRAEFDKLRVEVMSRLYDLEIKVHGADYVDTGDAA